MASFDDAGGELGDDFNPVESVVPDDISGLFPPDVFDAPSGAGSQERFKRPSPAARRDDRATDPDGPGNGLDGPGTDDLFDGPFDDPVGGGRGGVGGDELAGDGLGGELEVPASDLDDVLAVLDNRDLVRARDPDRLLWALATAGAQVRRSVSVAAERLGTRPGASDGEPPPRAVLVVTDALAGVAGAVLAHLGGARAAVLDWHGAELPRWAGPADVLLAASVDGRHPRVATLLADADRRGLTIVAVSPDDSPVAAAAGHGTRIPIDPPAHRRAALWTVLTPLLLAAQGLGVLEVSDVDLADLATDLDTVAELCRPDTDAFANAAKQLAVQACESDLLVIGTGPLSSLAARCTADALAVLAGLGASSLSLPDDLAQAGTLLEVASSGPATSIDDDFFRDRAEETIRRRHLLILPENGVEERGAERLAPPSALGGADLHDIAASRAAGTLDDIASARGIGSTRPELPGRSPLARFAAATALGHFAAAYAGIGRGIDPGAARTGEIGI